jgi:2-polyprenyl-3-methyl-5-hydroxy-6-metoxy-1,4-benzoquinol methylase
MKFNWLKFKLEVRARLDKGSKWNLLRKSAPGIRVLDVGCAEASSYFTKLLLPESYYVGIDICEYESDTPDLSDEMIITPPTDFSKCINELDSEFEIVISSHNLEHCYEPYKTLEAMCEKVAEGGYLYISFPCQNSKHFPVRAGSLNYFQDPTHQAEGIYLSQIQAVLVKKNMVSILQNERNRPRLMFLIGLAIEPISFLRKKVMFGTWALYGFETVILVQKPISQKIL